MFLAACLLLTTAVSAQVSLYNDCNYQKLIAALPEGNYPLAALVAAGGTDNSVSSIQVKTGYQITFYDADNYQGSSLVKTSDTGCLDGEGWNDRATSFKIVKIPVPEPPTTWQEHWFEHNHLVSRVYYDSDLALYYDDDMPRTVTWPNTYMGDVWRYTKRVYGSFGSDSRLFAVLHAASYRGGHPSTYFDASHDYRNTIDVGAGTSNSPWDKETGNNLDLVTHEVGHIVELASKGVHGSPAFNLWGDSKWNEIFIYDVYNGLGRTDEATRWYNLMIANSDGFPRAGTHWSRDWFYPIYSQHGGATVLNKFFELLAQYYPKNGGNYARDMNWGEFVHFWSAAGINLKPMATKAFGWPAAWETQFNAARAEFPFTYPDVAMVAYQSVNYGGYAVYLAPGSYTTAALAATGVANRDVSSLQVTAGYAVTLYENDNFTGASLTKTVDDASLVDDGWSDRAASLTVSTQKALATQPGQPAAGELTVFPSPTTAAAIVRLSGVAAFPATADVYDLKGSLLHSAQLAKAADALDISSLATGLYIIRVRSQQAVQTLRLLKK